MRRDTQWSEHPNFQSFVHNSRNTRQIEKCFKQKLKYIKFPAKNVPFIFLLRVSVLEMNNVEV